MADGEGLPTFHEEIEPPDPAELCQIYTVPDWIRWPRSCEVCGQRLYLVQRGRTRCVRSACQAAP